ncbi:hypothetical protein DPEC_G00211810 [Dallia pectoralis]|uniref:Uncharacterized protein n=1 Tax=Dallia pectoralis TaxID=75939 RepID=A0ACC2G6B8_DALPE|nr:hypothetical protein DPEC_G00211810 [Dallia pectoralis]
MKWFRLSCFLFGVLFGQNSLGLPDTALNCCEGDILVLLDSSGSVSSYEFSRLLHFLSELLLPFSLGRGQVRVGLILVGTEPRLEFSLGAHSTKRGLQAALQRIKQLQGDTNTGAALRLAEGQLTGAGSQSELPKVLLWLTDGVRPGRVDEPMAELKKMGVSVLAVSTGQGNYQVLRKVVTPPIENHLHYVDIDHISIITKDLREAIIEILRADRLWVAQVSIQSAVLQWHPVITTNTGFYELHYKSVLSGTQYPRKTLPGDSSRVEIDGLQPDTNYTASLTAKSNEGNLKTLSVSFTTLPVEMSPAVVMVSDSGPDRVRVSWGPLQPDLVVRYQIEYGSLPSGQVYLLTFDGHQNSSLLTGLQPDTQYLVTVSARYSTGTEKSMSVKACTQEVLPALLNLQLTSVDHDALLVQWQGHEEGLRGYWLRWEGRRETAPGVPNWASVFPGVMQPTDKHVMAAADLRIPGEGILIGDQVYSGVSLTLDNCLLPSERLQPSPSAGHGLSANTEQQLRMRCCEMIQAAGILLRLPQVAMATGQILFQRFYYCKSFVRHCAEIVAMSCVHLASKIEEEPRRVRDVLNVFYHLKHSKGKRTQAPMPLDANYINAKAQVIKAERRVLKELGFCVHVKHPHKIIVMYLQVLECEKNTKLVQTAWNYMNDSLRTDVFLRFSAETVACACIYLSARTLQIPLPDQPPWFLLFGASEKDLKEICQRILRLYALPNISLIVLLKEVDKCRLDLDTCKAKLAGSTPTVDVASRFSPASKPGSPAVPQPSRESPLNHVALKNACRKVMNGNEKKRGSHSDERREPQSKFPARRRRSRSVSSPSRLVSPNHRQKIIRRDREREREEREHRRECDRERDRERGRRDDYSR